MATAAHAATAKEEGGAKTVTAAEAVDADGFTGFRKEDVVMTHAVILCDSAVSSGLGHLIRCEALAAALRDLGLFIHYACENTASFERAIGRQMKQGFDYVVPNEEAAAPRGLAGFISTLNDAGKCCSLVIVDTYKVDAGFLRTLSNKLNNENNNPRVKVKVVVMDDHQHRTGDGIIRLCPMQCLEKETMGADNLSGVEYLLMRPDFMKRQCSYSPDEERSGLVICLGGADTKGYTRQCIQTLREALDKNHLESSSGRQGDLDSFLETVCQNVTVVASDRLAKEQDLDTILEAFYASGEGRNATRKHWATAEEMAGLFSTAAAAVVSSSGVGCEAAAMRVPALVPICWVDNQENHMRVLQEQGIHVVKTVADAVDKLVQTEAALADAEWGIDAIGAQRVAGILYHGLQYGRDIVNGELSRDREGARLRLRLANLTDAEEFLRWRNHVKVSQASINAAVIPMSTHMPWFLRTLMNPDRILFVLERESKRGEKHVWTPCGTCRTDVLEGWERPTVEMSWTIAPPCWGQGLSKILTMAVFNLIPKTIDVLAEIKEKNIASRKVASHLGLVHHKTTKDGVMLWLRPTEEQ